MVSDPNQDKEEEFLDAALEGDLDEVMALIDAGVDVRCSSEDGETALHESARYGTEEDLPVMPALLAAGCGPFDATTQYFKWTALHYAARDDALALIKCLLEAGAAVDPRDNEDRTPLVFAKKAPSIQCLLEYGADAKTHPAPCALRPPMAI